jgi:hypothetical protein
VFSQALAVEPRQHRTRSDVEDVARQPVAAGVPLVRTQAIRTQLCVHGEADPIRMSYWLAVRGRSRRIVQNRMPLVGSIPAVTTTNPCRA